MENKFSFGASSIHYRKTGSGRPLILIHGFGEDSTIWNRLIPLIDNATIYLPQLPGTEKSAMIAKGSMESYADVIASLIEHEAIQNPVMIGHSMGGYITLAFMEKYPGLVSAFGLFHSSALADDEEKRKAGAKPWTLLAGREAGPTWKLHYPTISKMLQKAGRKLIYY